MRQLTSNVTDTALIFEGGGMRASFSAGVLVALLEAGVHCDWVAGISAGSSCLVNYVTRDAERSRRSFVEIAGDERFGDWRTWLRGKGVFASEWIYEGTALPGQFLPVDWDAYLANPARIRIGGFRCEDGRMVYWGREDAGSLRDLVMRVRASSTMPLLMPLTTIDQVDYCDGALGPSGGIALDAARADGFEKFLVVTTRERGYRKPPPRFGAAYPLVFRKYPEVARALTERPARYNATLDELARLEAAGAAHVVRPKRMPVSNSARDVAALGALFEDGLEQGRAEMAAIEAFLGR